MSALLRSEIGLFVCPNPHECCPDRIPPKELRDRWSEVGFLSAGDAAAGQRDAIAVFSRCGCNRLAVRRLNIMLPGSPVRVIFHTPGMFDVPGPSINALGRHPNMFADAMVYAYQEFGVSSFQNMLITGGQVSQSAMNKTFEVKSD